MYVYNQTGLLDAFFCGVVAAVVTGWDENDPMPMHLVIGYQVPTYDVLAN